MNFIFIFFKGGYVCWGRVGTSLSIEAIRVMLVKYVVVVIFLKKVFSPWRIDLQYTFWYLKEINSQPPEDFLGWASALKNAQGKEMIMIIISKKKKLPLFPVCVLYSATGYFLL